MKRHHWVRIISVREARRRFLGANLQAGEITKELLQREFFATCRDCGMHRRPSLSFPGQRSYHQPQGTGSPAICKWYRFGWMVPRWVPACRPLGAAPEGADQPVAQEARAA